MTERTRERRELLIGLLLLTLPHLLFLAVDQRPPNDHDGWYNGGVPGSLANIGLVEGLGSKLRVVIDQFLFEGWHPQGPQTVLLAVLALFGPSLFLFRATNLLFFWLMLGGAYACGRQLRGHRFGLLMAGLLGWLPAMLVYARKWEPMFHGSAVSVVALAFALRCIRADAATLRWPWIGLGVTLGARFYTHPTALPDIFVVLGATCGMALWRARRAAEPLPWRKVALVSGLTLGLGAWYLGLLPVVHDEPSYRLLSYLDWRRGYLYSDYPVLDPHRNWAAIAKLVRGLALWHWQLLLLVIALPGLWLVPRLARAAPTDGVALLAVIAAIQLPPVFVTMKNGGMVVDWLHLEPLFLLLCSAAVATLAGARWLFGFAIANVVFAALVVPLLSLTAPDPVFDDRAWTLRWLDPWTHLETGDVEETPHLLSPGAQAGDTVARILAERLGEERRGRNALLEVVDATLVQPPPDVGAPWCGTAHAPPAGCCGFQLEDRGGSRDRFRSVWPFLFAGFSGLDTNEADADHRFVLVRLWHPDDVYGPLFEGQDWEPERATPVRMCLDAAAQQVEALYPGATIERVDDPAGRLISRMWAYAVPYAHRAFLVDRGTGVATLPPRWMEVRSPEP